MAKPKVNIASYFEDAMKEDGKEQITYLPIDVLDQNPDNFYSLEGIDELAGNIELIGLQQPIRVRPGEEPERYTIISGHRRRAAILTIVDGGSDQFKDGVPCIIEHGEASPAMRELRLIYANAATRTMSSADLSKQAERVTELLYQLKEEGVEFPGRMRDHVAEACKVSKTKLARLHAIRKNLAPDLLIWFDKGALNESEAYELQKLPATAQEEIAASIKRSGNTDFIDLRGAEHCSKFAEKFMEPCSCPKGGECDHHEKRFVQALRASMTWERCNGGCCLKCGHYAESCQHACAHVKEKQKAAAAEKKLDREAEKKRIEDHKAERDRQIRESRQAQAQRVLPLIRAKGLKSSDQLPSDYYSTTTPVSQYEDQAAGKFDGTWYDDRLIPTGAAKLKEMAEILDCSVDYLLGLTDDPAPAADREPVSDLNTPPEGWQLGDPQTKGRYLCTVDLGTKLAEQRCDWNGSEWMAYGRPIADVFNVIAWYPLPAVLYTPKGYWDEPAEDEEEEEEDDLYIPKPATRPADRHLQRAGRSGGTGAEGLRRVHRRNQQRLYRRGPAVLH